MKKMDLKELRARLAQLNDEEKKARDIYLKQLQDGRLQGPSTGYASIDKPWLKFYPDEAILAELPQTFMYDYLYECNKDNLDGVALNFYSKITYGKLFKEIKRAEKMFLNLGVKKGDVISLGMPFIPETIYAIYALNKIGAVANMCDPRVPADKFKDYINGANSKMLITLDIVCPKVNVFINDTKLEKVIYMPATNSISKTKIYFKNFIDKVKGIEGSKKTDIPNDQRYVTWNSQIENARNYLVTSRVEYEKDSPAIIVYTSGTSGEPKGAVLSNDAFNYIGSAQPYSITNVKRGDKFLLIMPPFIAYGLAIGMHGQLCTGQELIMVPTFNIDNSKELLGELVVKHKPQTIMGVPAFVRDLIEHPKMKNCDLSFLKNFIVGGDSISEETEKAGNKFLKEHNSEAVIRNGWGLTEVSSCFSYTNDEENNMLGSVGVPSYINNIRVLKETTNGPIDNIDDLEEAYYGEPGELFVQTPTKMIHYLNKPEMDATVFHKSIDGEEWIRTQDQGRVLPDSGAILIDGRMKRIIIRPDGHNVSPFAIENIIKEDPRVENCIVVGRPAEGYHEGYWPVAYIQLKKEFRNKESIEASMMDLFDYQLSQKLPTRDVANFYEFIDELPLTDIGKIDYKTLQLKEDQRERHPKVK